MRIVRRLVISAFVLSLGLFSATSSAQKLVYPPSDAGRDIASALAAAQTDGKQVLLDFGADWCPDCRVLGALFEDANVAPVLAANFHVVHVDVGRRDKNADIVAKFHATSDAWIPAVVVIDRTGQTVGVTDDKLRLTRRTSTAELIDVLKQWAPKKAWIALSSFREHGVDVAVSLERDASGQVWLAGRFAPTSADVHLYSKDLPADGIDGMGRPTLLRITSGSMKATGSLVADRRVEGDRIEQLDQTLPIYPAGPVTMRVPVQLPARGASARVELAVSYMGCGGNGCLPPVERRISVVVPARDR